MKGKATKEQKGTNLTISLTAGAWDSFDNSALRLANSRLLGLESH